jgi:hypothetical protein
MVHKHNEALNFRTCNYIHESWIMFLGFLLDYQLKEFIQASVAPFGHFLRWFEGPNKSHILALFCCSHLITCVVSEFLST